MHGETIKFVSTLSIRSGKMKLVKFIQH